MAIDIVPVTPGFAAEIGEVDLARLAPEDIEAVKQAFWAYGVSVETLWWSFVGLNGMLAAAHWTQIEFGRWTTRLPG